MLLVSAIIDWSTALFTTLILTGVVKEKPFHTDILYLTVSYWYKNWRQWRRTIRNSSINSTSLCLCCQSACDVCRCFSLKWLYHCPLPRLVSTLMSAYWREPLVFHHVATAIPSRSKRTAAKEQHLSGRRMKRRRRRRRRTFPLFFKHSSKTHTVSKKTLKSQMPCQYPFTCLEKKKENNTHRKRSVFFLLLLWPASTGFSWPNQYCLIKLYGGEWIIVPNLGGYKTIKLQYVLLL